MQYKLIVKPFALSLSKGCGGSTGSPRTASFYCGLAIWFDPSINSGLHHERLNLIAFGSFTPENCRFATYD
jgi:hypothetical protein